jgi:hypothetical protein
VLNADAAADLAGSRSLSPGSCRRNLPARALLVLLLMLLLLAPGCGSGEPPTAIPPTGDSPKESAEVRAKNTMINRD